MNTHPLVKPVLIAVISVLVGAAVGFLGARSVYQRQLTVFEAQARQQSPNFTPQDTPAQEQARVQAASNINDGNNHVLQGKVMSAGADSYVLRALIPNPYGGAATTTDVAVSFDSTKDAVKRITSIDSGDTTDATFADITVGAPVMLQVIHGVKTTYLFPTSGSN